MKKLYNAWKSRPNGDPIEGSDRIFIGTSRRSIIKHIAYLEGVNFNHNDILVRCKDGNVWHVEINFNIK